jgi:PAS domain S-box-containing protein
VLRKSNTLLPSAAVEAIGGKGAQDNGMKPATAKAAYSALPTDQELLNAFLEHIPDCVYFKDRDSLFVRISRALANRFGLKDPSESFGKADSDMFSSEHAQQALTDEQTIIRTGQPIIGIEEKETWTDGRETWVSTTKVPLRNAKGEIIGTMGVSRDITAHRVAQEELRKYKVHLEELVEARTSEVVRAKEQLERSNKDLEKFAYVASHDLQEPLRMVASYTQLIARRYKGKLDAEADEFIDYAVDGANRMQQLIQDLLAYSRLSRKGPNLEDCDSRAICESAIGNLRQAIAESGATVVIGPLPRVMADTTQLTQLFQNLIGNAIKYRSERIPNVQISSASEDGHWVFSVSDNGIGIEAQYFGRIFEMFQRLHTRARYAGTGIGLAICRNIAEHHGGQIWVESQPGKGSTFFFTIPHTRRLK